MTEFIGYNSIENGYKQKLIDMCAEAVGNAKMVALEKIHGANFSWIVSGPEKTLQVAKRSGVIDDLGSFYGHLAIMNRYGPTVVSLFNLARSYDDTITKIQLFGEIFGGHYEGETKPGCKQVQSGMNYCPHNEFMAFDLLVTRGTASSYMSFNDFFELIGDVNFIVSEENRIKIAPVIAVGSLKELLEIDPLFYTEVPKALGLEVKEEKSDIDYGEGFVIRGYDNDFITRKGPRVIIKCKNSKFGEKNVAKKITPEAVLTEAQQEFLDLLCSYLSENRVHSVLSKDTYTDKQFGRLLGDFSRDALASFESDEGYKAQTSEDWAAVAKTFSRESAKVVREVWVNL